MTDRLINNLLALATVSVWGLTFVSTKVLITCGLTPAIIFFARFFIAYLCILFFARSRMFADSFSDELWLLAAGLTGGSVYFIAENTALRYTFASNVSLIIGATPVFTSLLGAAVYRKKIRLVSVAGWVIAMSGVAAVILNGSLKFSLSPVGDILALLAALLWAVYCLLLKKLTGRYSNFFITRKIFFYGWLTAIPFCLSDFPVPLHSVSLLPAVTGNILFLGIIASFLCYLIWNHVVKNLGPEHTANYIYFVPFVTIISSTIILDEPVTAWMVGGGTAIIAGVYLTQR